MNKESEYIEIMMNLDQYTSLALSKTTHDINNPLTILMGQKSIMDMTLEKEDINVEKLKGSVEKIALACEQLAKHTAEFRGYYKSLGSADKIESIVSILKACEYYFRPISALDQIKIDLDIQAYYSVSNTSPNNLLRLLKLVIFEVLKLEESANISLRSDQNDSGRNLLMIKSSSINKSIASSKVFKEIISTINGDLTVENNIINIVFHT